MKCKFHITDIENKEVLGEVLYTAIKNLKEIIKENGKKIDKHKMIYVSVDISEKK